jgi:predicted TIM-barrel fold metal-dependent hydrolase
VVFDAWVFSCQLQDVIGLATVLPGTTIVLNHAGTPVAGLGNYGGAPAYNGKQDAVLEQWRADMKNIAKNCPNVVIKVGGNGLPHVGTGFEARDKPPTSDEVAGLYKESFIWVIKTFGAERCMFESNFPVDKIGMSYTVLWNALKRITTDLSTQDRSLLFSGTAKRVCRLG